MSEMRIIHSDDAPQAVGPYAQAVTCNGFVFCSGQIGLEPASGTLVSGGVESEARQALANLSAVLAAAGCTPQDVVRATIYLTSIDDFPKVNAIYAEWLGSHRPARATVAVAALPLGAKVEIDAIARISSQ